MSLVLIIILSFIIYYLLKKKKLNKLNKLNKIKLKKQKEEEQEASILAQKEELLKIKNQQEQIKIQETEDLRIINEKALKALPKDLQKIVLMKVHSNNRLEVAKLLFYVFF